MKDQSQYLVQPEFGSRPIYKYNIWEAGEIDRLFGADPASPGNYDNDWIKKRLASMAQKSDSTGKRAKVKKPVTQDESNTSAPTFDGHLDSLEQIGV